MTAKKRHAKSPPWKRVRVRERDGRRSVGIAICRDSIWMGVASYYSQKSGLWPSMEDPEPRESSSSSSFTFSSLLLLVFIRSLGRRARNGKPKLSMAKARRNPSRGYRLSILLARTRLPHAINLYFVMLV